MRVVLDTNVLASGMMYPGGTPGHLLFLYRTGGLDLVLSDYILDELLRIIPKMRKNPVSAAEAQELLDSLRLYAELVVPTGEPDLDLRDPAD